MAIEPIVVYSTQEKSYAFNLIQENQLVSSADRKAPLNEK